MVASKTPDQSNFFIVALELPIDRSGLPIIPRDCRMLTDPAAALLLQTDLVERYLQCLFVFSKALEVVHSLGRVSSFRRLLLIAP